MAIDLAVEQVVSLADAADSLPRRRRGKKPHVSCIYRWTVAGCRGVVLESIQVGGTRCTSHEALARFFAALSNVDGRKPTAAAMPARRKREIKTAEAYCARSGV